jgi:hypothetical protein
MAFLKQLQLKVLGVKNLVAGFALCDGHVRQHIPEVLVLQWWIPP